MKKFKIKDADGNEYEVTEETEEVTPATTTTPPATPAEETHDDNDNLTSEEIAALKQLAGVASKLVAMCQTTDEDPEDEDDEEEITDEDPADEEVITDSVHSAGSTEKRRKTNQNDSEDVSDDDCSAWSKRWGN